MIPVGAVGSAPQIPRQASRKACPGRREPGLDRGSWGRENRDGRGWVMRGRGEHELSKFGGSDQRMLTLAGTGGDAGPKRFARMVTEALGISR